MKEFYSNRFKFGTVFVAMLLFAATAFSACSREDDGDTLKAGMGITLGVGTLQKADSISRLLLAKGSESGDDRCVAYGYYLSSSFVADDADSTVNAKIENLMEARDLAEALNDEQLLCKVYLQLGILEVLYNQRPRMAGYYYGKCIEIANRLGELSELGVSAEINLSEIYRVTGDSLGKEHDLRLFDYARKRNDSTMMRIAAFHIAYQQTAEAGDTTELSKYARLLRNFDEYPGVMDMIYAKYYFEHGDYAEAERQILKTNPSRFDNFKLLHAQILHMLGRYSESNVILDSLLNKYGTGMDHDLLTIRRLLAESHMALGDKDRAIASLMAYVDLKRRADSLDNIDNMGRFKVEFDVLKKNAEIKSQREEMSRLRVIIACSLAMSAIIIAGCVFYIRNRNRFYRSIVRQSIDNLPQGPTPGPQGEGSGVSDGKAEEIYSSLTSLMEKEEIWRDLTITRDSLADKIGCNRTYLTDVIKRKTGMNYSKFMNSYRMKEAVRILSDTETDIAMKDLTERLGFLSLSNFYSVFKQETGISPAAFRKTAKNMKTDGDDR